MGLFICQLRALLYRAALLKRRTLAQTFLEITLLAMFALMASLFGYAFRPAGHPGADEIMIYNSTEELAAMMPGFDVPPSASHKESPDKVESVHFVIAPNSTCEDLRSAWLSLLRSQYTQMIEQLPKEQQQAALQALMERMKVLKSRLGVKCVQDEDAVRRVVRDYREQYFYGVVFQNFFNYTILARPMVVPSMDKSVSSNPKECRKVSTGCGAQAIAHNIRNCPTAQHCGTNNVQIVINMLIANCVRGGNVNTSCEMVEPAPGFKFSFFKKEAAKFSEDAESEGTVMILTLMMVLSTTPFVNFVLVNVVSEKEYRIKDGLLMMGMSSLAYLSSWFIVYSLELILACTIASAIMFVPELGLMHDCGAFFPMFLSSYLVYAISIIALAILLSTFFRQAVLAGIVGSLSNTVFALLYLLTTANSEGSDHLQLIGTYSLSSASFAVFFRELVLYQRRGVCESPETLWNAQAGPDYTFAGLLLFLIYDVLLYVLLCLYFDAAFSGQYDGFKRWIFFVLPSFWFPRKLSRADIETMLNNPTPFVKAVTDVEQPHRSYYGRETVRFIGLRKEFGGGEVVAVQGLTFDVYDGNITCLLGHNGAGKTTVINMMTGLVKPTYGTILINNYDVSYPPDLAEIRKCMGICPQFDILYRQMTVEEHLHMVGFMKGRAGKPLHSAVLEMLDELRLVDDSDRLIKECSLGTKRKLSVAMALLFDPKIVFLDEPTSGMDPAARRHIWEVLKRRREDKTIIMTTHFMDEADVLSDRKAIISHGHLLCCGSSLFLKNRFGVGYTLHVSSDMGDKHEKLTKMIQDSVPGAKLTRVQKRELVYLLPLKQVSTFPELFRTLERRQNHQKDGMGVGSFGISMTTLEDVFLKLASTDSPQTLMRVEGQKPAEVIIQSKPPKHEDAKTDMQAQIKAREVDPVSHGGPKGHSVVDFNIIVKHMENMPTKRINFRYALCALLQIWFKRAGRNMFTISYRAILPLILVLAGFVILVTTERATAKRLTVWKVYDDGCRISLHNCNKSTLPGSDFVENLERHSHCHVSEKISEPSAKNSEVWCGNSGGKSVTFDIKFNSTAYHMMPFMVNKLYNAILRDRCELILGDQHPGVACTSLVKYEQPFAAEIETTDKRTELKLSVFIIFATILLGLGLTSPGPSFAAEIVRARENRIAVMLALNGIGFTRYWMSIFLSHFLQSLPVVILLPVAALLARVEFLMDSGAMVAFFLLAFTSVPQNIIFCYFMSFFYETSQLCMSMLPPMLFLLGYFPFMFPAILLMADKLQWADYVHIALSVVDPPYIVFGGIIHISKAHKMALIEMKPEGIEYYFSFDKRITLCLVMNVVHSIIFSLLILLKETRFRRRSDDARPRTPTRETDSDVSVVEDYVKNTDFASKKPDEVPLVVLNNATLKYPQPFGIQMRSWCYPLQRAKVASKLPAVNHLCLTVNKGEIFGLLGPSGAGKTSTLKLITTEERLTRGRIRLANNDISLRETQQLNLVGYCPETDAQWDDVTLVEHFRFYSFINGLNEHQTQFVVNFLLDVLQIREHANKRTKNLSGGTRRKVSFAMAMLRCPKVVLLDEPSTGMDPQSKRFLWDAILLSFTGQRCAILTTQSMEEAEFLCDRVGIIVKGRLQCVGTSSHLTERYGTGYYLEVRAAYRNEDSVSIVEETESVKQEVDDVLAKRNIAANQNLIAFVKENFLDAELVGSVSENLIFHVPRHSQLKLSHSFKVLEQAKDSEPPLLKEYNLSQASLEQVFLRFAREQYVPFGERKERDAIGAFYGSDASQHSSLLRKLSDRNISASSSESPASDITAVTATSAAAADSFSAQAPATNGAR